MFKWILHFGVRYFKDFFNMKRNYCHKLCMFCNWSDECHNSYYCEICSDYELKQYLAKENKNGKRNVKRFLHLYK